MGGTNSMSWSPEGWGTTNPETGDANSPIGRFFQGAFGKKGSTTGQLPAGLSWVNDFSKNLAGSAPVDYNASTAAKNAGVAGSNALGNAAAGTEAGTAGAWNAGLGGLGQGISTGFMPSVNELDALMRPSLERGFSTGAADIREQNALTGNLSSTGASQQIGDYRAQLENQLGNNIAGVIGGAVPASIGARTSLTQTGLGLPGANAQSIWAPAAGQGLQGQDAVLEAIRTAFGAIGASPYTASQGSGGSGGGQGAMSMLAKGCWIAEAIFGRDVVETELARYYVNEMAPTDFRDWYMTHGQALAMQVEQDETLREYLRPRFLWFAVQAAAHKLTLAPLVN
jgi:hypothetical protein